MSRLRPTVPWFRFSPLPSAGNVSLTDCQVDSNALADNAVSTIGIQNASVDSDKIKDGSIDSGKLQDCAVSYQGIQNVTARRLLARQDAVAGTVQEVPLSAEMRFDTDNDWLEIADCGILSNLLGDTAVITAKVNDAAITYAKVQNVTARRLLARQDAALGVVQEVPLSVEMRFDTDNDWLEIADCGIISNLLGDTAVITAKINAQAVTYAKIQAVTAGRILGRVDTAAGDAQELSATMSVALDSNEIIKLVNDSVSVVERKFYGTDSDGTRNWRNDSDLMRDASTTLQGASEFATPAEINLGTDTTRSLDVYDYAQSNYGRRIVQINITDTTLATGDSQFHFFIPPEMDSWDLVDAAACVSVISTSGRPTIQIRNVTDAADFLTNKICIDSGEKTSYTADTAILIDTNNDSVVTGNELCIDVDSAGTGTEGLSVILTFRHRGA